MCSLHFFSRRKRVWISPCPGVAVPAVDLGPIATWLPFGRRMIYRDLDGRCWRIWMLFAGDQIIPRAAFA
jgi:hypothetical protein